MAPRVVDRMLTRLGYRLARFRVDRIERGPLRSPLESRRVLIILPEQPAYYGSAVALARQGRHAGAEEELAEAGDLFENGAAEKEATA